MGSCENFGDSSEKEQNPIRTDVQGIVSHKQTCGLLFGCSLVTGGLLESKSSLKRWQPVPVSETI